MQRKKKIFFFLESTILALFRSMTRSPRPIGTSSLKMSEKYLATCLNVKLMASSFFWSRVSRSSVIDCNKKKLTLCCSKSVSYLVRLVQLLLALEQVVAALSKLAVLVQGTLVDVAKLLQFLEGL